MSMVGEFNKALRMNCKGFGVDNGGGSRRTKSIVRFLDKATGKPLLGLWVKEATRRHGSQGYFWGLNENQMDSLNKRTYPWWLILLFGTHEEGYVAKSEDVNSCVGSGRLTSQLSFRPPRSEYKIHETEIPRQFSKCQNFKEIFGTLGLSVE